MRVLKAGFGADYFTRLPNVKRVRKFINPEFAGDLLVAIGDHGMRDADRAQKGCESRFRDVFRMNQYEFV